MDLSKKIKLILSGKNISPSIFADEIGIQRSSMSHILAGRNKPSLDIVQKIIKRFPDLGMNWIMDDQDLPQFSSEVPQPVVANEFIQTKTEPQQKAEPIIAEKEVKAVQTPSPEPVPPVTTQVLGKTVTKIMVFYSDGTFQELNPNG
ncbi:XRE family transcriptional regulator [Dyadobacter luteus]|uniref:XRE family transcriptional regulator n=1 Tax=Dyadobacter luteus TaxID=2259619 RepID=A0A3D8YH87_9BACT|nr:helix-turn-helix transcriptional regulator [Dyadobacter luteus]REA64055.1 XRE family transcriptional regulator [Dyadobacter luteus]